MSKRGGDEMPTLRPEVMAKHRRNEMPALRPEVVLKRWGDEMLKKHGQEKMPTLRPEVIPNIRREQIHNIRQEQIPNIRREQIPTHRPEVIPNIRREHQPDMPEPPSKFQKFSKEMINRIKNENNNLHAFQIEAVEEVEKYFAKPESIGKPCLVVAPTGSGKSVIANMIPYCLASQSVLVLTPSPIITGQLLKGFGASGLNESYFYKTGLITQPNTFRWMAEVPYALEHSGHVKNMPQYQLVVVNAQRFGANSGTSLVPPKERNEGEALEAGEEPKKLKRQPHKQVMAIKDIHNSFDRFDLIIVDEAHHYPAETWLKIVDLFHNKKIVFMTATAAHHNQPILQNQKIISLVTKHAIEGVYIRKNEFTNLGFKNSASHISVEFLELLSDRLRDILQEHDQLEPNFIHKAMVLVTTKSQAEKASKILWNSTYHHGGSNTDSNRQKFESGDKRVLVVCGKLIEGYDNTDVSVCVILRKVQSTVLFSQFVGRCLRLSRRGDQVVAQILSHPVYDQRRMYESYDKDLPNCDPCYYLEAEKPKPLNLKKSPVNNKKCRKNKT